MIEIEGSRLFYYDSGGTGEAIFFVHGFPMNHKVWDHQIALLSQHYRCIAPDLRGFGASAYQVDKLDFDMLADDIASILQRSAIEAAHIVGVSLGGMIAIKFAARYPSLTKTAVIMHAEAAPDDAEAIERRNSQIASVEQDGVEAFVSGFVERLFPEGTDGEVVDRLRSIMLQSSKTIVIAGLKLLRDRVDLTPLLSSIKAPALIIAGEKDGGSPPEIMRPMAALFQDGHYLEIEYAGHMSIMQFPDLVSDHLLSWLRRWGHQANGLIF